MTSTKQLFQSLLNQLTIQEQPDEMEAIGFAVLEHFGISRTDWAVDKPIQDLDLRNIVQRLNQHEPLQYVLNEAWFCGRKYYVDSSVLIPRPETELLVEEAIKAIGDKSNPTILDVGTGSGCIAISLSLMFPKARIMAVDISEQALQVAKCNSNSLNASVEFIQVDVLKDFNPSQKFDLIVSNPPYISSSEKPTIAKNVIDYEPHLALFLENDPLIFYRRLAELSISHLKQKGFLLAEINENYSCEVVEIYQAAGLLNANIFKDHNSKPRIVQAQKG